MSLFPTQRNKVLPLYRGFEQVKRLHKSLAQFFDYITGKTTRNITETYNLANDGGIPKTVDIGSITEKEVTLEQARASISYKLATPS